MLSVRANILLIAAIFFPALFIIGNLFLFFDQQLYARVFYWAIFMITITLSIYYWLRSFSDMRGSFEGREITFLVGILMLGFLFFIENIIIQSGWFITIITISMISTFLICFTFYVRNKLKSKHTTKLT